MSQPQGIFQRDLLVTREEATLVYSGTIPYTPSRTNGMTADRQEPELLKNWLHNLQAAQAAALVANRSILKLRMRREIL